MFHLSEDGGILTLTLDRPEARNAIPLTGWEQLAELIAQPAVTEARLLLLRGESGAFCAGADLDDFPAMRADPALRPRFRAAMRAAIDGLSRLPFPVIALIDGPCYGAGVALAMACDMRLCTLEARFAITPAKIGISYPQEDVHRLVALVGPGQAARLLFTAAPIDAEEAVRIGLADICAPLDALLPTIDAVARQASESLRTLKRGISLACEGIAHDEGQDAAFDALIGGPDLAERLERMRRR